LVAEGPRPRGGTTYAALTGFLVRKRIAFRSRGHRVGYWLTWFYIAASVPLHIVTGYVVGSTKFIETFPLWYSYLLLPVYAAIIWLYWRLPLRRGS
jgi:Ni/Fe-hydrogenase subunit HybB-like protein